MAEVTLRGLYQAERVVLGFPLAFFPPFILAAALAHSDPGNRPPPMPTRLGDYRQWYRAHFRTLRLPLAFPPLQPDRSSRTERNSRFRRRLRRQRETILRELAARGYHLPE